MRNVNIETSLFEDITDFCKANQITDVDDFINKTLRKGFDLKKYGESFAMFFNKTEADMIFNGPPVQKEESPIEEPVVKEEPKKKGGRKKRVEEPVVEPEVVEKPSEPVYEIKQEEEPKPVRKPVTLVKQQPKDNYDVYDEI